MIADIERSSVLERDGFAIEQAEENWGMLIHAIAEDGTVAGRVGLLSQGDIAVIDRLQVEPDFRSRGIATLLVAAAQNAAADGGATKGVLVATEMGRAIYERFGWIVLSAYSTARFSG